MAVTIAKKAMKYIFLDKLAPDIDRAKTHASSYKCTLGRWYEALHGDHHITTSRKAGIFHCGQHVGQCSRPSHAAIQSRVGDWGPRNSLESQHDAIAVWVLLLFDVDFTVDHGHDPVSELSNIGVTWLIEAYENTCSFTHFLMDDSLILETDAGIEIMLSVVRRLAVTVVAERRRTFIAWPYTSTPLNHNKA